MHAHTGTHTSIGLSAHNTIAPFVLVIFPPATSPLARVEIHTVGHCVPETPLGYVGAEGLRPLLRVVVDVADAVASDAERHRG